MNKPDVLGSTLTVALIFFALSLLFGGQANAEFISTLERTPAVEELSQAQANAAQELGILQSDLRTLLQKRLDSDIEIDLELIPETPIVSDAGASPTDADFYRDL